MKIIAIKHCSVGNESVGEMWKETQIFDEKATVLDVMKWVGSTKSRVEITIPAEDWVEFESRKREDDIF